MALMPVVDESKCDGCGLCVRVCYCGAFVIVNGIAQVVHTEVCGWCTHCEAVCPTGAISCPFEIVVEEV